MSERREPDRHRHVYRHVYLHVPFCARRCSYCDFAIAVRREVPAREFADSVRRELAIRHVESAPLRTLYLGGGTPSRLGAEGVQYLLQQLQHVFTLEPDAEVTLEANPEDVTREAVRAWRAAGVNRLSLGVQSFDDRVLTWMHRVHTARGAMEAVEAARAGGLDSFSVDLIFALPSVVQRDWSADLRAALDLEPDHISLYGLTVEPHTPLGKWRARGEVEESPEEVYEAEFLEAHEALDSAGYEHYEVSNYARAGKRAVHNSAYWQGVPYLGLGPSAHGFDGAVRRWNIDAFALWGETVAGGHDPLAGQEQLTIENRLAESVYLGLRTVDGLPMTASERRHLDSWFNAGWLQIVEGTAGSDAPVRVRCTPLGWLRLDRLASDLTALRSRS